MVTLNDNGTTPSTTPTTVPLEAAEAAFEKIRPQLAGLDPEAIVRINADIPTSAAIALGAYERLRTLRPQIVERLPQHTLAHLDDLPTYALAATYAHLVSAPSRDDDTRARKLLDEATPLRESLLVAAEALAHRGKLDPDRVAEIRAGLGNIDRASDLIALAALFKEAWARVGHRTDIDLDEVERAAQLGPELLQALGAKGLEDRIGSTAASREDRSRAFTLLLNAYDDCRQAATYLRWKEDDVDDFAPSLRPRPRSGGAAQVPSQPEPPAPTPAVSSAG